MLQISSVLTEFSEGNKKKDRRISFHVMCCSRKKCVSNIPYLCPSLPWKDECRAGLRERKSR